MEMDEEKAYARLASTCARRERSSGQVRESMRRWGLDDDVQERVLARLVEGRYVDDARYCEMFVRDKIKFGKCGRMKIEAELWQKGIASDIAAPVLDEVDPEVYYDILVPLLRQKNRSVKADSLYERGHKLMAYALGRGFAVDTARRAAEAVMADDMSDGDDGDDDNTDDADNDMVWCDVTQTREQ